MSRISHPLFALLVLTTRQDLARQVADLKEENRILPRLPAQISVTAKERQRLIMIGRNFWRSYDLQLRFLSLTDVPSKGSLPEVLITVRSP